MLSLGVKPGDYIMIGDNIRVAIIKQKGELRFTVEAPREIKILRGSLYEQDAAQDTSSARLA